MNIKNEKDYSNKTYESWKEVSDEKNRIINAAIKKFGISEGDTLLDVASGTGVLYAVLKHMRLSNYVALDISENMLRELKSSYPEVKTVCGDFDKKIMLEDQFDYIIIFNSIPHFENLDIVFSNAIRHLKVGGLFSIVHSKTRDGLNQHHKSIGYDLGRDAIPNDAALYELAERYEFKDCIIDDEIFFYFSCKKI